MTSSDQGTNSYPWIPPELRGRPTGTPQRASAQPPKCPCKAVGAAYQAEGSLLGEGPQRNLSGPQRASEGLQGKLRNWNGVSIWQTLAIQPRRRASKISPEEIDELLDRSADGVKYLRETLSRVFRLPKGSMRLR